MSRRHTRILLILDTCHGQVGGTELNTYQFARALAIQGFDPIVVEIGQPLARQSVLNSDLQVVTIDAENFSDVGFGEWRLLLKTTQPALVVRSKGWVGCGNWRLDVSVRISGASYLGWEHHPADARVAISQQGRTTNIFKFASVKAWLRKHIHSSAVSRTVAVSHAVKEPLVRYYAVPADRIDVIYPGVDFDEFRHSEDARVAIRREWEITSDAVVIGSLGRLVAHKSNDFILRIFAEFWKQNPNLDVYCVIAGKGPDLANLIRLADELAISDRVRFPGWQESASHTWSAIDVSLLPSLEEGLGTTIIEAVACGCIPLAAAVGGMTEVLSGPLREYALIPNHRDHWVTAVNRITRLSPTARQDFVQQARARLKAQFDAERQWVKMTDWVRQHSMLQ